MSLPTLTPASTLSAIVLPVTGNLSNVNSAVPYKIYSNESAPMYSGEFISGAVDQVSFVYKNLVGDVLDIELTEGNVYAAYEEYLNKENKIDFPRMAQLACKALSKNIESGYIFAKNYQPVSYTHLTLPTKRIV